MDPWEVLHLYNLGLAFSRRSEGTADMPLPYEMGIHGHIQYVVRGMMNCGMVCGTVMGIEPS